MEKKGGELQHSKKNKVGSYVGTTVDIVTLIANLGKKDSEKKKKHTGLT